MLAALQTETAPGHSLSRPARLLMPCLPPPLAPPPAQVHVAWLRTFALPARPDAEPADERERHLGVLLDGLALVAAGRVPDETGQALELGRVVDRLTAHETAAGWHAELGEAAGRR